MNLIVLQNDLSDWLKHNFPDTTSDHQIKGVMEELGELCEADLVYQVNPNDTSRRTFMDAVGDVMIYLFNYCNKMDIMLVDCISDRESELYGAGTTSAMIHLGRLVHADLKSTQGIRGYDDPNKARREIIANIAGLYYSLSNYCLRFDLTIQDCIKLAFYEIMKRDWIVDPKGGKVENS